MYLQYLSTSNIFPVHSMASNRLQLSQSIIATTVKVNLIMKLGISGCRSR